MTNQDILVTVGMPVHNGAFYLVTALESIREQTHQNLQVLVFDDGSTDGSGELARAFPDARLEVLAGKDRAGVGAARQQLKSAAAGDYLVWCDADDVFEPDRVEVLLQEAVAGEADIVIDTSCFIDEAGDRLEGVRRVPDHVAADPHFTRLFERNRMNPHPLVKRSCFAKIDFDAELTVSEDYDFWLKAVLGGYRFLRVDRILHRYRLTSGSLSSRPEKAVRAVQRIFGKYRVTGLKELYRRRGFPEEVVRTMACLQHVFRQEYTAALAETDEPWADEDHTDRDFYRGTLLLALGRETEAEPLLRRHLARQPDSPAGHSNLGVLEQRLSGAGAEHWRRALDLFPGYHDALANIGGQETVTMTQLAPRRHR